MQELPRTGYLIPGRDGTRAWLISRVVRVSARALFGGFGIPNPLETSLWETKWLKQAPGAPKRHSLAPEGARIAGQVL